MNVDTVMWGNHIPMSTARNLCSPMGGIFGRNPSITGSGGAAAPFRAGHTVNPITPDSSGLKTASG